MHAEPQGARCPRCTAARVGDGQRGVAASSAVSVLTGALSLLPGFTCPACIAAYASLLSTAGLGFVLYEPVLRPVIIVTLALNLVALAWTARGHGSWAPLVVAVVGSAAVLLGRFLLDVQWLLYSGAASLIVAAAWNLWLKRSHGPRVSLDIDQPDTPGTR